MSRCGTWGISLFRKTLLLSTKIKLLGVLAALLLFLLTSVAVVMAFFNEKRVEALAAIPVYQALLDNEASAKKLVQGLGWKMLDTAKGDALRRTAVPVVMNKKFEQGFYGGNILMHYADSELLYTFTVGGRRWYMLDPDPPRDAYRYVAGIAALLMLLLFALYRFIYSAIAPIRLLETQIAYYRMHHTLPGSQRIIRDDETGRAAATFYALVASNEALKAQRTLFTRNIIHELKTPLMQSRLLAAHAQMPETLSQRLEESVARQSALLDELLDLESLLRGDVAVRTERFYLLDIVDDVLETLACEKSVTVDVGAAELDGDYRLIFLILKNLVDNACRYAMPKSEIIIRLDTRMRLCISNRGDALDKPIEHYYEPFRRNRKSKGMGLGLYIVRELVTLHDHTLSYDYKGKQHIFCVCFKSEKRSMTLA